MEVGLGPNVGCSAKGKKRYSSTILMVMFNIVKFFCNMIHPQAARIAGVDSR
jgi:hypothetical protein